MAHVQESHVVRWDDQEWEDFATLLHEDNPSVGYMTSADLARLTTSDLNNAGAQMARPRHFVALAAPRKKLLEAFARLREKRDQVQADPNARFHRAPPPAEPATPLKLDHQGRPLAPAPGAAQKQKADPFAAVAWDRSEWLAIATEIDRAHPMAKYPEKDRLTGLDAHDVDFAQRVLPATRQIRHIKVASFSTLAPALLDAFRDLKKQRMECEAERTVLAKAESDAKQAVAKAATTPAKMATPAAAPAPNPAPAPFATPAPVAMQASAPAAVPPVPALVAATALANPWEAAFAPMMEVFISALTARLEPTLAAMVEKALLAPAPAAAQAPATPPARPAAAPVEAPASTGTVKEIRAPRMRIGIVGNRTTYATDLARDFPEVRFTCIDNLKEVDSIRNCDRVLVLTKFISHKFDGRVRAALERSQYTPVNGCLSDMRRVITGLLHDQESTQNVGVPAMAA
jgi:hypothetical protein